MKYDVFISYSRKDTKIADRICAALDKQGISYFIDRRGIGGGMEFPSVLADAILSSQIMLFLGSENSYKSKFTSNEVTFAFNEKPRGSIIPYIIDGSTLPQSLRFTFSSINIRTLEEHPIETTLIQDLCQILDKKNVYKERERILEKPKRLEEQKKKEEYQTNDAIDFSSRDGIVISEKDNTVPFQIADDLLPYNYQLTLPSFFSRILLFDKAFSALATHSNEGKGDGYLSLLASECLDLLEFLFLYGNRPDLEIRKVSITRILSELKSLDTPNSRNLLSVFLQDLPQLPSYYSNTDAFIFRFRNKVIGCTSPLTIVFTSPQCKSIFQSWSDEFRGVKGQLLFKEHTSFKERGKLFQEYLIRLLSVCHYDKQILQYVRIQSDNELSALFYDLSLNKDNVSSIFPVLKDEHGYDIYIVVEQDIVVRLGCVRPEQLIATEYCIQSNRPNSPYKTNTEEWELPLPLVLNDHGILGTHYIKDWPQSGLFLLGEGVCKVPLNERVLPETSFKYPYLVAEDFLEECIVKLDFNANEEKFYLIGDKDNTYLPPIKLFYFRYFDLNDLITSLHYQQLNDDRIEVTLDIPVVGNGTKNFITLRRVYNYSKGDVVSIKDYDFRLSVWPDYRLPNDKQNLYSVSVGETNDVRFKFFSLENSEMEYEVKWHQIDNVRFCNIGCFDAIQLYVNDIEALLFPLFKQIGSLYPSPSPLRVGIDFGSSSTRVSYTLYDEMPQSLEIMPKQVMNLNQFHDEIPGWKSELTEMRMIQEDMGEYALPPYLPAYEHSQLYIGLKQASAYMHQEVMKNYCDQVVWILKNQIINDLHGGAYTSDIKVNLSLPSCISARESSYHLHYWNEAFQHHFGDGVQFKIVDDTLSLHTYTLRAGVSRPFSTTLLLDIGKRNSSIAIYDTAKDMLLSCSYPIGIGDLWENDLFDYRTNAKLYHLLMDDLSYNSNLEKCLINYIENRMQKHENWMDYLLLHAREMGKRTQLNLLHSIPDLRVLHFMLVASIIWKAIQDITPRIEIEHLDVVAAGGGFVPLQCFMGENDSKNSIAALFSHFLRKHLQDMKVSYLNSLSCKAAGAAMLDFSSNPINTKISPLYDIDTLNISNEVDKVKVENDFLSFINAMQEFDTTGLPLDLNHICNLFEQYAHHGTRLLQTQYRDDYLNVQDAFFWPLKGSLNSVICEIL